MVNGLLSVISPNQINVTDVAIYENELYSNLHSLQ